MEAIVRSTPTLYAGYLEKLSRIQSLVTEVAAARLTAQSAPADAALRAATAVGAALACMTAAQTAWLETSGATPIGELLDRAMATVHLTP